MKFHKKKTNEIKHKRITDFGQAFFTANTLRSGKSYLELDTGTFSIKVIFYDQIIQGLFYRHEPKMNCNSINE